MPLHLRVGDKFIGPGSVGEVLLRAGDESVRVLVYSGLSTGSRLFMVAGLHGNEKLSLNIAREVSESLDPRQLHGVVLLVPEASATAIRDATRDVPGSGDLNRAFPGDPKGDGAHQIAYALFR